MRYLDLLSKTITTQDRATSRTTEKAPYERTKKGCRVAWTSPTYGLSSGRLLIAPADGWVLVQGEHTPDLLVWVREDLCHD